MALLEWHILSISYIYTTNQFVELIDSCVWLLSVAWIFILNYGISHMQHVRMLIILTEFILSLSSLLQFMQWYYIEIGYNFLLTDFYYHYNHFPSQQFNQCH